jgi:hypothetical protein
VSDPGTPPPDWAAVFHRARRRILGRLLLVGAIGAGGALLLLGGGLEAQGSVSLGLGFHGGKQEETQTGTEAKKTIRKRHVEKHREHRKNHEERRNRHPKGEKPKPHPRHCAEEEKDSSEIEYGYWNGPSNSTGDRCPEGKR